MMGMPFESFAMMPFANATGGLMLVFGVLIAIGFFVFWLWTLVDALQNLNDHKLVAWVAVLILLHILGSILYVVLVYRPGLAHPKKSHRNNSEE